MFLSFLCCLAVDGLALSDAIRTVLLERAFLMIDENRRSSSVRNDDFEGELATEFESYVVGTFVGYRFTARLDMAKASGAFVFLVRPMPAEIREQAQLNWVRGVPNDLVATQNSMN